jgi:hypothetical protein
LKILLVKILIIETLENRISAVDNVVRPPISLPENLKVFYVIPRSLQTNIKEYYMPQFYE